MRISRLISSVALATAIIGGAGAVNDRANADTFNLSGVASGALVDLDFTVSGGAVTGITGSIAGFGTVSTFSGTVPNVSDVVSSGLYVQPPSGPVSPGTVWTVQNPANSGGANFDVDNVWGPTAPYLTFAGGVAFLLSDGLTAYISDAFPSNSVGEYFLFLGNGNIDTNFDATVTATPLPSTWTFLIAGFAGLGFFAYHGSKKNGAALAAV